MFVPVACSQCGKPFQVPEAAVGGSTVCPWCQATVLALPVGVSAPTPAPAPPPALPAPTRKPPNKPSLEPLSLDDASDSFTPELTPPDSPAREIPWRHIGLGVVVLLLVAAVTFGVLQLKSGPRLDREWEPFSPPDNSCGLELLGKPIPDPEAAAGEKWYVSEGRSSGTKTWLGWRDLTQVQVQLAATKDAWQHLGSLFDSEGNKLKTKYAGNVNYATIQFENPLTRELRIEFPGGRVIERMIVMHTGKRPRVYFLGMAGKFDPDGPDVKRFFESFKVFEEGG